MPAKNSLINIFSVRLPAVVTRSMCNEFDARSSEIYRIWNSEGNNYAVLQPYESTVQSLLALSLFYRYVLCNISGASNFYKNLKKMNGGKDCSIQIGDFELNRNEHNRMLAVIINFMKIIKKYNIPQSFFEYSDTIDFLRNCNELFKISE